MKVGDKVKYIGTLFSYIHNSCTIVREGTELSCSWRIQEDNTGRCWTCYKQSLQLERTKLGNIFCDGL